MKKLSLIWPLIDGNIDDQSPKFQKNACKSFFFEKISAGMLSRRPRKCWCAIPVHSVPLLALLSA